MMKRHIEKYLINKKILLLIIMFIVILLYGCVSKDAAIKNENVIKENPEEYKVNLSENLEFELLLGSTQKDKYDNHTNIFLEYNGIETDVFKDWKYNEDTYQVALCEDINNDGKKEIVIYLQEKVSEKDFIENIYFIDYETGEQITLDNINEKLNEYEKLKIEQQFIKLAFSNISGSNLTISYLLRSEDLTEQNFEENSAYQSTIIGNTTDNKVVAYKVMDEMIYKINYFQENIIKAPPSVNAIKRSVFMEDRIILKVDEKIKLYNWKIQEATCKIDLEDINKDNIMDIILLGNEENDNLVYEDDIFIVDGKLFNEIELYKIALYEEYSNGAPELSLFYTDTNANHNKAILIRHNDIYYLNNYIPYNKQINYSIKDFNYDDKKEIVLYGVDLMVLNEENFNEEIYIQPYWEILQEMFSYKIETKENEYLIDFSIDNEVVATQKIILYNKDEIITEVGHFSEEINVEIHDSSIQLKIPISYRVSPGLHRVIGNMELNYKMIENEFVLDDISYTACEIQNLSNSSQGNMVNHGLAASDGKYIYFTDVDGIYRTNTANKVEKIYTDIDRPDYLSIYNEYLYFMDPSSGALYKIGLDGGEKQIVLDDCCSYYTIYGDYIYYIRGNQENMFLRQLYKIRIDGTDRKKLCDTYVVGKFTIYDSQIFYLIDYNNPMNPPEVSRRIYRMNTDGSENGVLVDNKCKSINVYDGWIYYVNHDEKRIYRIKPDGSNKTKISDACAGDLNVYNGWVYFTNFENKKIYKLSLDDWSNVIAFENGECYYPNIVNDWLYYLNIVDVNEYGYGYTYKVKLDGYANQKVVKIAEE